MLPSLSGSQATAGSSAFAAAQHLDGTNRQVMGSLQQRFITAKIIAVHNERRSPARRRNPARRRYRDHSDSHLEHAEQLAGETARANDQRAGSRYGGVCAFHAERLDIIGHPSAEAGADHDPLAVDPAHASREPIRRFRFPPHSSLRLSPVTKEDIFQRVFTSASMEAGVDDGQLNILFAHRLDAAQRNAPLWEKDLRRGRTCSTFTRPSSRISFNRG